MGESEKKVEGRRGNERGKREEEKGEIRGTRTAEPPPLYRTHVARSSKQ